MKPVANFASDAVLSAIAAATGRGISLLGMVVTTRIFPAETYGTWLLILTFANFFSPLATLRLEIPLVMTRTQRMVKGLLSIIVMCLFTVVVAVTGFCVFANAALIERVTGLSSDRTALIYFSVPALILLAGQILLQSTLMRAKHFRAIALVNLLIPVFSLIMTLFLPRLLLVTPQLAAIIFLTSTALGLAIAVPFLDFKLANFKDGFSNWTVARVAFRHYSVYPKFTLPLSMSASVTERVTQLVLAQAYSLDVRHRRVTSQCIFRP
jgi:O-antigen/teichoic acid export membrane protein